MTFFFSFTFFLSAFHSFSIRFWAAVMWLRSSFLTSDNIISNNFKTIPKVICNTGGTIFEREIMGIRGLPIMLEWCFPFLLTFPTLSLTRLRNKVWLTFPKALPKLFRSTFHITLTWCWKKHPRHCLKQLQLWIINIYSYQKCPSLLHLTRSNIL